MPPASNATDSYIISGGAAGKARLSVLAEVLRSSTRKLLLRLGNLTGKTLLDVGCGGGHVAFMMGELVGISGNVTAIDFDGQLIALNQQQAAEAGITNVHFETGSAYALSYENAFDRAYARFLLSHLQTPEAAIGRMRESLKKDGWIVVEDVQFSGHFSFPENKAFNQYLDWYAAAARHNNQHPEIGPELPSMLRRAGFTDVAFDVIQPAFETGPGKQMALITLDRIKDTLQSLGIADATALAQTNADLQAFTESGESIISLPRIFRAWGRKP